MVAENQAQREVLLPPVATTAPAPQAPSLTVPQTPKPPVAQKTQPPVVPPTGSYTQVMVNYAISKVGGPDQWDGNGPVAFDCSGLVQQDFAAAGTPVPRQCSDRFWAVPRRVPLCQMRYGDVLVFNDDGTGRFAHIAIYVGNNQVAQALNPSQPLLNVGCPAFQRPASSARRWKRNSRRSTAAQMPSGRPAGDPRDRGPP